MRSRLRTPKPWALLFVLAAATETRSASGLAGTVEELAGGPEIWIAYSVPVVVGDHEPCCYDAHGSQTTCRLDDRSITFGGNDKHLVGTGERTLRVLLRVGDRRVQRVRVFGSPCVIDPAGAKIHELEGVDPDESVAFLGELVRGGTEHDLADEALAALSLHAAPSAGRALFRFAAPESPDWVRAKAAFWLGETRGEEALGRLREMAREDASAEVADQAVFAISISDAPGSEAVLIDLARHDPRADKRSKALFWLSQEAGARIPDTIRDAVENDPSLEVKEQAVFALSQLPPERGIPLLIDIARSADRHPAVRRAAMFWLGQSGDPRALAFFEDALK